MPGARGARGTGWRKFVGRHRGGVALTAAALGALLVGAGGARERTLAGRAEVEARKAKAVEEYLVARVRRRRSVRAA